MPAGFGVRALSPQNIPTTQPKASAPLTPDTVYDLPSHITAQLNDPRFPDKAAIINNYYQSLIKNSGPGIGDNLSNFLGESKDYQKKVNAQQQLRRLLTPNY